MSSTRRSPAWPPESDVLSMVLLSAFTTPLMMSATNVALPHLARELALDAVLLGWVPLANLMASAMFVLIFGNLADRHGRRRIFLLGTAAMILSSLFAAASVNPAMLLTGRFLQGISAAMLYATQIAIISSVFPARHRGRMVGLVVASIYTGLAVGPLLGGVVTDLWGWRAAFLLQVPLALAVLAMGLFRVRQEWTGPQQGPFDLTGAAAYAGGILLLCLAVSRPQAGQALLLFIAALVSLTLFVRHALRTPHPLWDLRLFFNNRAFTFACGAALLMYSATHANVVLVSLFLQYLKGLPAAEAGLLMMVQPLAMAVLSPFAGRLSDRVDTRLLTTLGLVVTAAGLFLLASLGSGSPLMALFLALLLTGIGFSLFSSPNVSAIMGSVGREHLGKASAAVASTRLLGQLASVALVSLVLSRVIGNQAIDERTHMLLERSIGMSFTLAALLCVGAILLSWARGSGRADGDSAVEQNRSTR